MCTHTTAFGVGGMCAELFTYTPHMHVQQETDYFCGPAVLQAALARQYVFVAQTELARLAGTNAVDGTSPVNMMRTVEHFGLKTKSGTVTDAEALKTLMASSRSVIALVSSEGEAHWVLLDRIIARTSGSYQVKVMDPWTQYNAHRTVGVDEFFRSWKTTFNGATYQNFAISIVQD